MRVRSEGFAKNVPPIGYSGRSNNDVSSPLNSINPQDIERVEVIKGAAATTLYGTEASAGVIQIFTKRGSVGEGDLVRPAGAGTRRATSRSAPIRRCGRLRRTPLRSPAGAPTSSSSTPGCAATSPMCDDPIVVEGQPCDSGLFNDLGAQQQKFALNVGGGGEERPLLRVGFLRERRRSTPQRQGEEGHPARATSPSIRSKTLQLQWNSSYTNDDLAHTAGGNNAHGMTLNTFRRDRNYLNDESFNAINPFLNQEITTQIDHVITGLTATHSPMADW